MKKITATQKVSFVSVLLLVLVATGYVLLYKHIGVLREKLSTVKVELWAVEKLAENKQATLILLDETRQGREELSRYFVPLEDPTTFLELVESSAKDAGVLLEVETLAEVASEKGEEGTKKIKAVLLVEGGWQNVYHCISLLEHMPFAVTVTQAVFTVDQSRDTGVWKGQIHLEYSAK
jgi:hypothetical protein